MRPPEHEERTNVTLLESIAGPEDLNGLSQEQLVVLASEIRDALGRNRVEAAADVQQGHVVFASSPSFSETVRG